MKQSEGKRILIWISGGVSSAVAAKLAIDKYTNTNNLELVCNDVYTKDKYLVGVRGARCSLMMKKKVRQKYENLKNDIQVFGYDWGEVGRAKRFNENNPEVMTEYPLIDNMVYKADAQRIVSDAGMELPLTYKMGFPNANCLHPETGGCVKASSIKYWQRIKRYFPIAFEAK